MHLGSHKTINLWDLPHEHGRNPFTSKVPQLINFWKLALHSAQMVKDQPVDVVFDVRTVQHHLGRLYRP